jgi:REP-associated tyrosine transposase
MIHGYHVVFGTYGFWLPNDPRGSWSDFVGAWELVRFGKSTKSLERHELTPSQEKLREQAKEVLKYPPVALTGVQARAVGRGFATGVRKSGFAIWACSLLPEHVHLVIARHTYKVEQIVNLLKGEATKQMKTESVHPLMKYADSGGSMPTPWARGAWKVYLETEVAIEDAIRYVEENPVKEEKPRQQWSFVTAFSGLDKGWITYH